jgi:hypothetical protein
MVLVAHITLPQQQPEKYTVQVIVMQNNTLQKHCRGRVNIIPTGT